MYDCCVIIIFPFGNNHLKNKWLTNNSYLPLIIYKAVCRVVVLLIIGVKMHVSPGLWVSGSQSLLAASWGN